LWKEDTVLIQDMRKSCKKGKHSMEHWRELSRTMDTMFPHCFWNQHGLPPFVRGGSPVN